MPHISHTLIRADAGPRIGTGHVMRCIALGQAVKRIGGQVDFVCGQLPGKLQQRILNEGFGLATIESAAGSVGDVRELNKLVAEAEPNWVLLDGYGFSDEYQAGLALERSQLACIDDFGHAKHDRASLVLNQNIYSSSSDYSNTASKTETLTGSRFTMLRDEFASKTNNNRLQNIPSRAKRILVTFGGADPNNMTAQILETVDAAAIEGASIDVILGPCYEHAESLRELVKTSRSTIRLHRNVDNMYALMNRIHLAITGGGTTSYELARCGIPSIVIPIADNQIPIAEKLNELGIAALGNMTDLQSGGLKKLISRLIRDVDRRREMSDISQKIIDGQGANRVARHMVSKVFHFRDAELADAQLLLNWRNEPEVRAVSFQNKTIPFETHRDWLANKLGSRESRLKIIEDAQGTPVAQIRLDFEPQNDAAVISINVIPSCRGRGLGTALIERATREITNEFGNFRLIARIKASNTASQNAFSKAGFTPTTSKTINDHVALEYVFETQSPPAVPLRIAS